MLKKGDIRDILFFILFAIVASVAIGVVYWKGFESGQSHSRSIIVRGISGFDEESADFSIFWDAWSALKSKFVDKSIVSDNKKLIYGAISGMYAVTGDPYTTFFSPMDAHKFGEDISGQFEGIGAEIGLDKNKQLMIIAPLDSTPAARAGLQAGDKIMKINGENTDGIALEEAVTKIRGQRGSIVTLTIYRDGWDKEKNIKITRGTIEIPTLKYKRYNFAGQEDNNGKIAYIRLYNFYQKSPILFYQTAMKMMIFKPSGIIFDLRNNPGGYLNAAVSISGWFIKKDKSVVMEEFQDKSKNKNYKSPGPATFKGVPIVVLINKGSASASEIMAGVLQEEDGAEIVGEKSFGKGTVQEVIRLSGGAMAKITIAHWLTPSGKLIDGNGITPDVKINIGEKETQDEIDSKYISKAIDILRSKIN